MQRVLVQLVMTATGILGKAFAQAYTQARAGGGAAGSAAKSAAGAAGSGGGAGMDVMQARAILQVGRTPAAEEVLEQYRKYFEANDPDKGGSFYLQSKVSVARDVLLEELKRRRVADGKGKAAAPATAKGPLR